MSLNRQSLGTYLKNGVAVTFIISLVSLLLSNINVGGITVTPDIFSLINNLTAMNIMGVILWIVSVLILGVIVTEVPKAIRHWRLAITVIALAGGAYIAYMAFALPVGFTALPVLAVAYRPRPHAKRRRSGIGALGAILIIVVLIVFALAIQRGGMFAVTSQAPVPQPGGPELYVGDVQAEVAHYNSLDISTSLTEGTNVQTTWFVLEGGRYTPKGSGDGAVFAVNEDHQGFVYAVVAPVSGQNYYLDIEKTIAQNERISKATARGAQAYRFFDIDEDGVKEHVFALYVGDLPPLTGGETAKKFYFNVFWFAYEKMSLNSPSDITGVGTTSGTVKYVEWKLTFTNTRKAWLPIRYRVVFNTTSTEKWSQSETKLNIPGVGYVPLTAFDETTDGTNTYYDYWLTPRDLSNTNYVKLPTDALNNFPVTLKLSLSLSTGDQIGVTLYVYGLDTTGALEQATGSPDTVGIAA
jgi:hypothetical protein